MTKSEGAKQQTVGNTQGQTEAPALHRRLGTTQHVIRTSYFSHTILQYGFICIFQGAFFFICDLLGGNRIYREFFLSPILDI